MEIEHLEAATADDAGVRAAIAERWRDDASVVLNFAAALLAGGVHSDAAAAIADARDCWFSLLADESFGQSSIAAPADSSVEALRLLLLRARGCL